MYLASDSLKVSIRPILRRPMRRKTAPRQYTYAVAATAGPIPELGGPHGGWILAPNTALNVRSCQISDDHARTRRNPSWVVLFMTSILSLTPRISFWVRRNPSLLVSFMSSSLSWTP